MNTNAISETSGGAQIHVAVVPRSGRTGIVGVSGGVLKVRVKAPPVDGRANEELLAFLAESLDVPRTTLRIASGLSARRKVIHVAGLTATEVTARLLPPAAA